MSEWIALWVMLVALTSVVLWLVAWAHRHLVTLVLDVENLRNQVNALRDQVHDEWICRTNAQGQASRRKGTWRGPFPWPDHGAALDRWRSTISYSHFSSSD